jgi:hypothetical protein
MFYQNYLAMRNTADVTGGKPIAIRSQSISDVSAVNRHRFRLLRHRCRMSRTPHHLSGFSTLFTLIWSTDLIVNI